VTKKLQNAWSPIIIHIDKNRGKEMKGKEMKGKEYATKLLVKKFQK